MRVVQVSAHYPPNFVSGGTLVPQRIAQGLARRGHDVWVYAGHLDESRARLSTWTETDDAGVRVRWVSTTPWTGWGDPLNSDNPAVAADFASWLTEISPDVVHLHSLQTLGGGLVEAAKASGAATVVTMHDFWWSCARQFLVDREMRPCSLVVDCGSCACQVNHEWLLERNARLAAQLAHADVVLAPSRSAAEVFLANGVDPDVLRVDENGVPDEVLEGMGTRLAADAAAAGPVRFMFAGGADPMKGLPVLVDAVRGLPDDGRWSLDLYGSGTLPADAPGVVRDRAPYGPKDLADVLGAHDVLVLPSVMRESHSIVTREALAAGLTVVCTDTLGPEEAVEHGRNGLVVRAGDASALRSAMTRLIDNPDLVASLRSQSAPTTLRRATEQVDGLERLYGELVADRQREYQPAVSSRTLHRAQDGLLRNVLFVAGINGAPLRYRVQLPAEALRAIGRNPLVRHYRDPELVELVERADAVVLYRVPATHQMLDLVERARARRRPVPILFDVDDLIVDPTLRGAVRGLDVLSSAEEELWWRGVARYRTSLEAADMYVGSTEALCAAVGALTGLPTRRFANGVGSAIAQVSEAASAAPRTRGPLRIGYFSGTTTHDADWAQVEPAVLEVMRVRPDVELVLGGHLEPSSALDAVRHRVQRRPMVPWYELPKLLRDVDVNLAPLVPGSIFNESKSAIKWLEAALVGTPTIATPTQPFAEVVEHGRTGMLAETVDEWTEQILDLLGDEFERARIGREASRHALLTLSPHRQATVYQSILRDAAQAVRDGVRDRVSGWEPVVDDEPLRAGDAVVDPYPGIPANGRRAAWRSNRIARSLGSVARVHRAAGLTGVARKSGAAMLRTLRR